MKAVIKNMHNKSRKGYYAYVKEKNLPGRYYKIKTETPIKELKKYKQYYREKYVLKRPVKLKNKRRTRKGSKRIRTVRKKRTTKQRRTKKAKTEIKVTKKTEEQARRKFLKLVKKYDKKPKITTTIKTGITSTTIILTTSTTNTEIRRAYEKLLKPLVKDEQLLDIIIENSSKLKKRFSYRVEMLNAKGETLAVINDIANKDLKEAVKKYQELVGAYVDSTNITRIINAMSNGATSKEQVSGIKIRNGIITRVKMTAHFSKGKGGTPKI